MRYLTLLFVAAGLLTGCAHELDYADKEYGLASMDAYNRMIVHKDYIHADKTADHMEGLYAEPTMELYYDSFGEGFTQESVDTQSFGGGD